MLDRQQMRQLKIEPPDQAVYKEVLGNWDALAKPLDGMGEFEELFARIGAIRRDPALDISRKAVVVMCADNGIVEEKISQSGQDVTAKVAAAMGRGTSSVCRMAKSSRHRGNTSGHRNQRRGVAGGRAAVQSASRNQKFYQGTGDDGAGDTGGD